MKKLHTHLIAGSLAGMFSLGCTNMQPSTQPIAQVSQQSQQSQQTQEQRMMKNLMELRSQGTISDTQTVELMSKLMDVSSPAAKAPRTTQPATTQIQQPAPVQVSNSAPTRASIDPTSQFPQYAPQAQVRGRLRSVGSDTMDRIMALWESGFKHYHKGIRFMHEGKGSSTAIPAIMENRAELGPMSRAIKEKEVVAFSKKFGYKPTQLPVAIDALAVYVHPDNPIAKMKLSLNQLNALFAAKPSSTPITRWGQLGLTGQWANAPINLYGRNSASGTASFFGKKVLNGSEYKQSVSKKVGSAELIRSIAGDRYGIGYSGIGYLNKTVTVVPISRSDSMSSFKPNQQYAVSNQYPLARFLYLTVNDNPGTAMPAIQREFVRYIYSAEGQKLVSREGFFPITATKARQLVAKLK